MDIARVRCAPDRVTPWVKESCAVLERHTVGELSRSMELVGPSHSDGRRVEHALNHLRGTACDRVVFPGATLNRRAAVPAAGRRTGRNRPVLRAFPRVVAAKEWAAVPHRCRTDVLALSSATVSGEAASGRAPGSGYCGGTGRRHVPGELTALPPLQPGRSSKGWVETSSSSEGLR